ncbi:hypothetical protein C0Q70_13131 [Pomacea canaliculata]|uniref:BEACH domain-containing protein n=1 Tax=Pomacea canaliculata TaxID=400727 RepID=A0A2T7NWD0_POMCA|nr:hypothetical protein C0Q70_13131 [Pomacea canaliculata]
MNCSTVVSEKLQIPSHCCRPLSSDRVLCLVTEEWMRNLCQGHVKTGIEGGGINVTLAEQYLSSSCLAPPAPWIRITIKLWSLKDHISYRPKKVAFPQHRTDCGVLELMSGIAHDNLQNLWNYAQQNYSKAHLHDLEKQQSNRQISHSENTQEMTSGTGFGDFLPKVHIKLKGNIAELVNTCPRPHVASKTLPADRGSQGQQELSLHNVLPVKVLVEAENVFLLVQPYVDYTLHQIVSFSPAILETCHVKSLFIAYQILKAMLAMHKRGLCLGHVSLNTVLLDSQLWAYILCPQKCALTKSTKPSASERDVTSVEQPYHSDQPGFLSDNKEAEKMHADACDFLYHHKYKDMASQEVEKIVEKWVQRQLSNFQYLIILNHLAGRQMNDPNNHPVLPWVMDFSSSHNGYRDLTKSKYRLTKGDGQLDFTYGLQTAFSSQTSDNLDSDHIPHHVSDVLSDITYYVYKARRMPKSILCTHVRSNWVPHEYPSSMQRLQEWTPDECIPEFFTDPTLFQSIHADLADLEVPPWCNSAYEFVVRHLSVLESERVSEQLHHWIDLTFGYKLSGKAAVAAKNVYLQLVDGHKTLSSHGVLQLFTQPHPQRQPPNQRMQCGLPRVHHFPIVLNSFGIQDAQADNTRPELATIQLPSKYEPLENLERCESLLAFKCKTLLLTSQDVASGSNESPATSVSVIQDIAAFLCLICEIFLAPKLRMQELKPSLKMRIEKIKMLCSPDMSVIPRPFQKAARLLWDLQVNEKKSGQSDEPFEITFTPLVTGGFPPPSPSLFLHPLCQILPFPSYFCELHACLSSIKAVDAAMQEAKRGFLSFVEKSSFLLMLFAQVPIMETFLVAHGDKLGEEGLEVVMPLIQSLFSDKLTTVQASWGLFNLVSRILGPGETGYKFLPNLTALFMECPASAKHVKLYHRTFLTQLLLRLRLQPFLHHFATLLVEAVAGYKDFPMPNRFYPSEELIEEMETMNEELIQEKPWSVSDSLHPAPVMDVERRSHEDIDEADEEIPDGTVASSRMINGVSDEFSDEMYLDDQTNDIVEFELDSEGDERETGIHLSAESEVGEGGEENAEKCSIHSISNILCLRTSTQQSQGQDTEEEDVPKAGSASNLSSNIDNIFGSGANKNMTETMKRSETEDLMSSLSQNSPSSIVNIRHIAADSVKWLAHKLGPVLAARYLSRNLVRMLPLCYLGDLQLQPCSMPSDEGTIKSSRHIVGDNNAFKVLECIAFVAALYGENIILIQFIPSIIDLIAVAQRRLTQRSESGLLGAVILLRSVIPMLSEKTLLNILEPTVVNECISPLLSLLTSATTSFPSGAPARSVLCLKLVDLLYVLGLRLGLERTRRYLHVPMLRLMEVFSLVHGSENTTTSQPSSPVVGSGNSDDTYLNIKMDDSTHQYTFGTPVNPTHLEKNLSMLTSATGMESWHSLSTAGTVDDREECVSPRQDQEKCWQELTYVFTPELALAVYIPLCRIFGSIHMEEGLKNDDLIRQLCAQQDSIMDQAHYSPLSNHPSSSNGNMQDSKHPRSKFVGSKNEGFGSNVELIGNRIFLSAESPPDSSVLTQFGRGYRHDGILDITQEEIYMHEMEANKTRHLQGNWLQYWEHELGLHERDNMFSFKQIRLQSFVGHSGSIRSLLVMDTENCFLSTSKDKTVRLWSITSQGDGISRVPCQWIYQHHKKSVFSVAFVESLRLVASCDSSVHVWDPFTGVGLCQLESSRYSPAVALQAVPAPSPLVLMGTTDATVRFLDLRTLKYGHEFRCSTGSTGLLRCVAVSPDGSWVAVGFSTGIISILELNSGLLQASWKAHDGEILQACIIN